MEGLDALELLVRGLVPKKVPETPTTPLVRKERGTPPSDEEQPPLEKMPRQDTHFAMEVEEEPLLAAEVDQEPPPPPYSDDSG